MIKTNIARLFTLLLVAVLATPVASANTTTGKDAVRFNQLLEYAYMANAAYRTTGEIKTLLSSVGYTLNQHKQVPGYGVNYFVATNDLLKQQIIAVRGTSSIENAMVDVAFQLLDNEHTGIKLHQGFSNSSDYIYDTIKSDLNKDYTITTTGHSLGGAIALVLAMYADADGFKVGKVITYGQPKVTNISGSRKYSHLDVTRVVMPKDMVPLVPPVDPVEMMKMNFGIYWHQGTEIVLQENNAYSELEGLDSMMRATDFMNEVVTEKNLQHHYMSVYIASLKQKLAKPVLVPYENDFSIFDLLGGNKTGTTN